MCAGIAFFQTVVSTQGSQTDAANHGGPTTTRELYLQKMAV